MGVVPVLVALLLAGSLSAGPIEGAAVVDSLRARAAADRRDVEARRRLADLLAGSPTIEGRREAAEALTEALLVDEGDADLWIRLARLRKRQNFRGESRRAYHRALALAPERADIWNELAREELLRYQRFHEPAYLDDAEHANRAALDREPDNVETIRRQIRVATYRARTAERDSLGEVLERVAPGDPLPAFLRGIRRVEAEDWLRATREFETGLSLLDPETRRWFETPRLVDPREEERSFGAPDSARVVRDYWRWRDPTPADPSNPRLLDHYRRMVLADLYFAVEDRGIPGWRQQTGEMFVRYGAPPGWRYEGGVQRGEPVRMGLAPYAASSLWLHLGTPRNPLDFGFIDFAMNGIYVRPPSMTSSTDLLLVAVPSYYEPPFREPECGGEFEVLRFVDRAGQGWIEVAAALPGDTWPGAPLAEPERLVSRVAVYDSLWTPRDEVLRDWTWRRRDPLGRLVTRWRFPGTADSVVVGLETLDLDGAGRGSAWVAVGPRGPVASAGPIVSDIAVVREVRFDSASSSSPYACFDGEALPNPGHRFLAGEPVGLAFAAFHLGTDDDGGHRARLRVTLSRATSVGWVRMLLGGGGTPAENELRFEVEGRGDRLEQLLSLAVPLLEEGDYRLAVEVEDLLGGGTAGAETAITIVERPKARP